MQSSQKEANAVKLMNILSLAPFVFQESLLLKDGELEISDEGTKGKGGRTGSKRDREREEENARRTLGTFQGKRNLVILIN